MNKNLWLMGLCLLAGCATTGAQGSTLTEPEMKQSLETFAKDMMGEVAKGDFTRVKAAACPEAVAYDIGDHGQPIVARGKAEVDAYLDGVQQMMHAPGMEANTTVSRMDCRVDDGPGYCLIELDQSGSMNGQAMPAMKMRATLIAKRYKDHWIWTHWHASFREMPDMNAMAAMMQPPAPPAPEPAAAAPAAK